MYAIQARDREGLRYVVWGNRGRLFYEKYVDELPDECQFSTFEYACQFWEQILDEHSVYTNTDGCQFRIGEFYYNDDDDQWRLEEAYSDWRTAGPQFIDSVEDV